MNVLKEVKFNKKKAAEVLNIDRKTLYNKLKSYEEFLEK
jgi:Response regulator containing CheY-like receiver, AAA-type ATPase, and DNA-binding domains